MLGCLYVKINEDRFGPRWRTGDEILKNVINALEIRNLVGFISEGAIANARGHETYCFG